MKNNKSKNAVLQSRSRGFLAGARTDFKLDLEPEPIFWVGSGSFCWQVKNGLIKTCLPSLQLRIKMIKFFDTE